MFTAHTAECVYDYWATRVVVIFHDKVAVKNLFTNLHWVDENEWEIAYVAQTSPQKFPIRKLMKCLIKAKADHVRNAELF